MIKIKEISKIGVFFRKIGRKIFKNPIILFAVLLVVDLIVGGILSWKVIIFPETGTPKTQPLLVLNKANLDKFVQDLAIQEEDFQKNGVDQVTNIFIGFKKPLVSSTSSTPSQGVFPSATSSATSTQVK